MAVKNLLEWRQEFHRRLRNHPHNPQNAPSRLKSINGGLISIQNFGGYSCMFQMKPPEV